MFKKLKLFFKNISYLFNNNIDLELKRIENESYLNFKNTKFECEYFIRKIREDINSQFNIDLDIHTKPNLSANVIVTGKYKGEDYIKLYSISANEFNMLVDNLRNLEKFGNVRNIDAQKGFPRKEFKKKFDYTL